MDDYIYSVPVHKDFHIVLNDIIKIARNNFDEDFLKNFLRNKALTIYEPLVKRIRRNGLIEIKEHFEKIFNAEGGQYLIDHRDNRINIAVHRCPALDHLAEKNIEIDRDFCRFSTGIINKIIAEECGYNFSLEYDQDNKSCRQSFWK